MPACAALPGEMTREGGRGAHRQDAVHAESNARQSDPFTQNAQRRVEPHGAKHSCRRTEWRSTLLSPLKRICRFSRTRRQQPLAPDSLVAKVGRCSWNFMKYLSDHAFLCHRGLRNLPAPRARQPAAECTASFRAPCGCVRVSTSACGKGAERRAHTVRCAERKHYFSGRCHVSRAP